MAKQTITYDPQVLDLVMYSGDGVKFRLVVTDALGVPIELTGTMRAQIRPNRETPGTPDEVFNIDLSESTEGVAILSLTGEQTEGLANTTPYSGVWDLEWTPTGEEPITLCQGKVECAPDVSH